MALIQNVIIFFQSKNESVKKAIQKAAHSNISEHFNINKDSNFEEELKYLDQIKDKDLNWCQNNILQIANKLKNVFKNDEKKTFQIIQQIFSYYKKTLEKEVVCENRGKYIGKAECGCSGERNIYECNAFEGVDGKKAFCVNAGISKPLVYKITDKDNKILFTDFPTKDIHVCSKSCSSYQEAYEFKLS